MPKAIRLFLKIFCVFVVLGLLAFASISAAAINLNSPPADLALIDLAFQEEGMRLEGHEDIFLILEVRGGETASSVGRRLENAGVIRNSLYWNILSRLSSEHIKAGTYRIELPMSQSDIRSILVEGHQLHVRVTIPEGSTLRRTGRLLEQAGICSEEDFLIASSSPEILERFNIPGSTMEGYLFPDTYLFPLAFPAHMVVSAMAETFFLRLYELIGEVHLSPAELNNRVILASIVEREYRVPEEAAIMAGVFDNRLRIGMALQSCATVEYVITEVLGRPHPNVILFRDLEIQDPYNTYLRPGLPPGPISAPSLISLRAVFNPALSDYLYFRLIDQNAGRHYFSRTYDEHIRAGTLYTKGI